MKEPETQADFVALGAKPVLDHGFVYLVDHMGDDAAVIQAARTSYGKGTKTPSDTRSLIRYLMRHWHSTPFEMVEFKFHMRLPVFVARQMIRHRTANVNEYSARYSVVPELFYEPELTRIGRQSTDNKQGTGMILNRDDAEFVAGFMHNTCADAFAVYETIVRPDNKGGEYEVARELARIILPQNAYTEWYWKQDLHNLLHLVRLRIDPHAQWEVRQYAETILEFLRPIVPITIEAFEDYRLYAETFSRQEMEILRKMIAGQPFQFSGPELSSREWIEFGKKLGVAS